MDAATAVDIGILQTANRGQVSVVVISGLKAQCLTWKKSFIFTQSPSSQKKPRRIELLDYFEIPRLKSWTADARCLSMIYQKK